MTKVKAAIPDNYYGITFPPYEFKEYPKWITLPDGTKTIVQDRAAEREAMENTVAPAPIVHVPDKALASVNVSAGPLPAIKGEEKAVLIQIAEERGVTIDKRWNARKLRAAIEAKEAET